MILLFYGEGQVYVVTENEETFQDITQSIASKVKYGGSYYNRAKGIFDTYITQGQNGPGIGFSSTFTGIGGGLVIDFWSENR